MSKELFAEAMLGKDAEEFVNSEIGQFVIGCAEQEVAEAKDLLSKVHPWRTKRIRELQNQVWRGESFQSWIAELVMRGRQALQSLDDE